MQNFWKILKECQLSATFVSTLEKIKKSNAFLNKTKEKIIFDFQLIRLFYTKYFFKKYEVLKNQ